MKVSEDDVGTVEMITGGNETEVVEMGAEETITGIPWDNERSLIQTCATISNTFAKMFEVGTSPVTDLVTTTSSGSVEIGKVTAEVIIGDERVGKFETNSVSGMISLSEEKSRITNFRFLLFLLIFCPSLLGGR